MILEVCLPSPIQKHTLLIFSEFVCTSDSHCAIYSHEEQNYEINGYCNKTTGECECEHGLRFNGSQCVGK